jgi:hypothetical protein
MRYHNKMDEETERIPARTASYKVRHLIKRPLGIVTASAIVLALLAAAIWYVVIRETNPFPPTIRPAGYTLFYPQTLPAGFYVDKASFEQTSTVTTYTVIYDSSKKLIFSIQAKPAGFDFDGLHQDAKKLKSSIGQAYAGAIDGRTVVSIPTDDSWLLVGVPSDIKTSTLETVLSNLQVVRL